MTDDSTTESDKASETAQALPPCMRRADRGVTDDNWIQEFLGRAPLGQLATSIDGQPFVTHNTFYYDQVANSVYMHTAINGHLRAALEENSKVCFTVAEMGRLLPAKTAREMSVEYASVIVYGRASVITDMKLAINKMGQFVEKYFPHLKPGVGYRPITDKEIREISVFEIMIDSWSAKQKSAEEEFPGAFNYGLTPVE